MSENYWKLVGEAKSGDRQAMVELYAATNLDTYRAIFNITANEEAAVKLTANTYETAFTNFDKLGDAAQFPVWCRTIGENIGRNYMRGQTPAAVDVCPDAVPLEVNRLVMAVIGKLASDRAAVPAAPAAAPAAVPAPAAVQTAAAAPKAKKKGVGKIVVIVLVILALLAGGFFAVKQFIDNRPEDDDDSYIRNESTDSGKTENGSNDAGANSGDAVEEPEQHYAMMDEEALKIYEAYGYGFEKDVCGRALADITHDGIPELITTTVFADINPRMATMKIYTIVDYEARELWTFDKPLEENTVYNIWLYEENGEDYLICYSQDQDTRDGVFTGELHIYSLIDVMWEEDGHSFGYNDISPLQSLEEDEYPIEYPKFWMIVTEYCSMATPLIDYDMTGGAVLSTDVYNGERPGYSLVEDLFGSVSVPESEAAYIPIEHLLCATLEEVFANIGEGEYDRGSYLYNGLTVHQYYGAPDNFVISGPGYGVYGIRVGDSEEYAREVMEQFPPFDGRGTINVIPPDWHFATDGVNSQNYLSVFCENGVVTEIWYGMYFNENY